MNNLQGKNYTSRGKQRTRETNEEIYEQRDMIREEVGWIATQICEKHPKFR